MDQERSRLASTAGGSLRSTPATLRSFRRRALFPLADEFDLRPAGAFELRAFEKLAHVAELFLGPVGIVKVIPLLQDRAMLGDTSKRAAARCLAGEPIAFAI